MKNSVDFFYFCPSPILYKSSSNRGMMADSELCSAVFLGICRMANGPCYGLLLGLLRGKS